MEVVKNLTEGELDWLRSAFEEAGDTQSGLAIGEFADILKRAALGKNISPEVVTDEALHDLFNEIDFNGDTKVSWEEFTMFIIDNAMKGKYEGDEKIRKYMPVKASRIPVGEARNGGGLFAVAAEINKLRYFPDQNEIVKVSTFGSQHKLKVINPTTLQGTKCTPKLAQPITAVERIPENDLLVTSSAGMRMHFWDMSPITSHQVQPRTMPRETEEVLSLKKTVVVPDTQLCLRYCPRYNKLFSASRTGSLNYWAVDRLEIVRTQPKVHDDAVLDLLLVDQEAITASLDSTIKIRNLERSVCTGVLKGHTQGVCTLAFSKPHQFLISAGFEYDPLVWVLHIKDFHPWRLTDKQQPHHGAILGLFTVPDTPQVITADSQGMVKVWDLRTFQAVQTILPWQHWSNQYHARSNLFSASVYVDSTASIILSGPRSTFVYEYQQTNNHDCADNTPVITSHYSGITRSIVTVHKRGIKVWDENTGFIESVFDDLVSSEVTSFTLCSRGRKFFLGTITGQLYGYVTSTGLCVQELASHKAAVSSLTYGTGSRGYKFLISLSQGDFPGIIIHADSSDAANVPVTAINLALQGCPPTTANISQGNSIVVIGTTTGRLVCVDTHSFAVTHVIESLHSDLPRTIPDTLYPRSRQDEGTGCEGEISAIEMLGGFPAFVCGDSTGHLYVWCVRPYFYPQRLVCRWKHCAAAEAPGTQIAVGKRSFVGQDKRKETYTCTAIGFHQTRRDLYVGDDHGYVTVYSLDAAFDKAGLAPTKFPASNDGAMKQPRTYTAVSDVQSSVSWRAHSDEVNTVEVVIDMNRVTIFTSGFDLKVHIWSTAGVMIASLCQGRQRDKAVQYSRSEKEKDANAQRQNVVPWEFKTAPTMLDELCVTNPLRKAKAASERLKGLSPRAAPKKEDAVPVGQEDPPVDSLSPAFITQPASVPHSIEVPVEKCAPKGAVSPMSVSETALTLPVPPKGSPRSPTCAVRKVKMPSTLLPAGGQSLSRADHQLPAIPRLSLPVGGPVAEAQPQMLPHTDRPSQRGMIRQLPRPPDLFRRLEETRQYCRVGEPPRMPTRNRPPTDFHKGPIPHPAHDPLATFPYHGWSHPHVLASHTVPHSAHQRLLYWADYRSDAPVPPSVTAGYRRNWKGVDRPML